MIKVNPKERLMANSYLEKKCDNGLFKKTYDSYIVGVNDIKVNILKDAISQAKETNNRIKTSILWSPQWIEIGIDNTSLLVRNLQGNINGNKIGLINSLLTIKGSIFRALVC